MGVPVGLAALQACTVIEETLMYVVVLIQRTPIQPELQLEALS